MAISGSSSIIEFVIVVPLRFAYDLRFSSAYAKASPKLLEVRSYWVPDYGHVTQQTVCTLWNVGAPTICHNGIRKKEYHKYQ